MPQKFLDGAKIGAPVKEVGGAGVAKRVRMQIGSPGPEGAIFVHEILHCAHPEATTASAQEHGVGIVIPGLRMTKLRANFEVSDEGLRTFFSDGDRALLLAFAEHARLPALEIDIAQ